MLNICLLGLPQRLRGKESASNTGATGDAGSIPGAGRSLGAGHGNPLQYSCLENPTDPETWWVTVQSVAKSWTRLKQLSPQTCTQFAKCMKRASAHAIA